MHSNIKPCWWGSHLWQTIYFIVATYPDNPTSEEIESIKNFFKALKKLLPCSNCKESYCKFSCDSDTNIENIENFKSKSKLLTFVHCLRNKVNGKLAHEYNISLSYFRKKISYMVIDDKNIFDGRVCEMIEAPFINPELEKKVFEYLKQFSSYDSAYTKKLLEVSKKFMKNPNFDFNDKNFKFMYKRHKKCRKIMSQIYHRMSEHNYNIIQSFLSSDAELHKKLLYYGCSILHRENLETVLDMQLKKKIIQ